MPLPNADSVARTCRPWQVDDGKPQPAAFELRFDDSGHEPYLSVNWLEHVHPTPNAGVEEKVATLRAWLLAKPKQDVLHPQLTGAFAVLKVAAIQGVVLTQQGCSLDCSHEPIHGRDDPHSGVQPDPGVETWPTVEDAPGRLAVQQFLYKAMSHYEPGKPAPAE